MRDPVIVGEVPVKIAVSVAGVAVFDAVIVTVCDPPGVSVNVDGVNARPAITGADTVIVPVNPFTPLADTVAVVL